MLTNHEIMRIETGCSGARVHVCLCVLLVTAGPQILNDSARLLTLTAVVRLGLISNERCSLYKQSVDKITPHVCVHGTANLCKRSSERLVIQIHVCAHTRTHLFAVHSSA